VGVSLFVGIDIGGTKTHVLVEEDNHVILDRVLPTSAWQCGGLLDDDENVTRLLATIADVAGAASAPLVIGAHGLDSEWQTLEFQLSLTSRHLGPVRAVNDVELLGPAGGFDDAIAVIVGTGSKVVAHTSEGASLSAGGYGFLLSDPGSAAMLARQAVRAVLNARDAGLQPDALAHGLMNHFGVDDEIALSYAFTANARLTSWGALAPIVFAAADDGSTLAAKVVDDAAKELAFGVGQVCERGAVGADVVCAGGVISNQPRFYRALAREIDDLGLGLTAHLLTVAPVTGALALARRMRTPAPSNESRRNS
jgi:glucosamine kinase